MEIKIILHPIPSKLGFAMAKSTHRLQLPPYASPTRLQKLPILCAAASPDSNSGQSGGGGDGKESNSDAPDAAAERRAPPAALNIRYRARSRRQARQEKQKQQRGLQKNGPTPAKEWEEMTLSEKALELYVGEKGLLFWLNKLAYASIFAIIGGWILFRFVGPSLGLYQLDGPPLSPTSIFKGGE